MLLSVFSQNTVIIFAFVSYSTPHLYLAVLYIVLQQAPAPHHHLLQQWERKCLEHKCFTVKYYCEQYTETNIYKMVLSSYRKPPLGQMFGWGFCFWGR